MWISTSYFSQLVRDEAAATPPATPTVVLTILPALPAIALSIDATALVPLPLVNNATPAPKAASPAAIHPFLDSSLGEGTAPLLYLASGSSGVSVFAFEKSAKSPTGAGSPAKAFVRTSNSEYDNPPCLSIISATSLSVLPSVSTGFLARKEAKICDTSVILNSPFFWINTYLYYITLSITAFL